jgi:hypothetical protein
MVNGIVFPFFRMLFSLSLSVLGGGKLWYFCAGGLVYIGYGMGMVGKLNSGVLYSLFLSLCYEGHLFILNHKDILFEFYQVSTQKITTTSSATTVLDLIAVRERSDKVTFAQLVCIRFYMRIMHN